MELANEIIQHVRSYDCSRLKYTKLAVLLEFIIYNETVIDILKKTPIHENDIDCCFNISYNNFISQKKTFILMNDLDNLALSWLFCLYH